MRLTGIDEAVIRLVPYHLLSDDAGDASGFSIDQGRMMYLLNFDNGLI